MDCKDTLAGKSAGALVRKEDLNKNEIEADMPNDH